MRLQWLERFASTFSFVNAGGRTVIDERTGERLVPKPSHSLFFINMEYWSIPLVMEYWSIPLVLFSGFMLVT